MADLKNLLDFQKKEESGVDAVSVQNVYEGEDKIVAAASYLYFVSAFVLVIRKGNSEFVRYHAKQAFVLMMIALLGAVLLPSFFKILSVSIVFLFCCYGAYNAYLGKKWYLPYITDLANSIEI